MSTSSTYCVGFFCVFRTIFVSIHTSGFSASCTCVGSTSELVGADGAAAADGANPVPSPTSIVIPRKNAIRALPNRRVPFPDSKKPPAVCRVLEVGAVRLSDQPFGRSVSRPNFLLFVMYSSVVRASARVRTTPFTRSVRNRPTCGRSLGFTFVNNDEFLSIFDTLIIAHRPGKCNPFLHVFCLFSALRQRQMHEFSIKSKINLKVGA